VQWKPGKKKKPAGEAASGDNESDDNEDTNQ
jgi:hypothetical protein